MENKGVPVVGYVGEGGRVFIPEDILKKIEAAKESAPEKTHSLQFTIDEIDNITAADGKLTALLHFLNDGFCSGNEIETGDALWMFIYIFDELSVINKAVRRIAEANGHAAEIVN